MLRTCCRFIATLIFLIGCSNSKNPTTPTSKINAIIGEHSINFINPEVHKDAQGVIEIAQSICNATVIASNQVATALHCIKGDPMAFIGAVFTSFNDQTSSLIDILLLDDTKDIVIYQIDRKLDTWLNTTPGAQLKAPIMISGKSIIDERLFSVRCHVVDILEDLGAFSHKCDTVQGMSGAAITQNGYFIGFHHGAAPDGAVNYGVDFAQIHDPGEDIEDIGAVVLEFGHIRSPHVRSPHIRSPHVRSPHVRVPKGVSESASKAYKDIGEAFKKAGKDIDRFYNDFNAKLWGCASTHTPEKCSCESLSESLKESCYDKESLSLDQQIDLLQAHKILLIQKKGLMLNKSRKAIRQKTQKLQTYLELNNVYLDPAKN